MVSGYSSSAAPNRTTARFLLNLKMGIMNIMDTKTLLENDLKNAMRSGDVVRKRALRMALSAIKLSEVQKGAPLDESQVLAVLQKEIKSGQETIAEAEKANRPEISTAAQAEIAILENYLPPSLTQAELEALVRATIMEVGATTPAEMGKVMKVLMPKVQGRATGEQVSQTVRKLLQ
jgi:uncharacterized protein